ncbi:MAG: histone H1 [Alphaproteobacteria bacterium]|nr:histone H1 [Alphaproteobacteria bacterium]
MAKNPKRPRDPNQLAKLIVDISTGEEENVKPQKKKEGQRQGGLSGGKARAESLNAEERRAIAKKAADARWKNKN